MKGLAFLFFLFFVVLSQSVLFYDISIFGVSFNFVLVFAILLIFWISDIRKLAFYILFLAFFVDVFSGFEFGLIIFSYLFLFFILYFVLNKFVSKDNLIVVFIFVVLGTAIYYLLSFLFLNIYNIWFGGVYGLNFDFIFVKTLLIEMVYNLFIAMFFIFLKESEFIYGLNILK